MPDETRKLPDSINTFSLEEFWAGIGFRSVPPSLEFVEAVKGISKKDVRDEALSVLYDETQKIEGDNEHLYVSAPGLAGAARKAQYYWNSSQRPRYKSPAALKSEFEELGAIMRELAGRLRTMSGTARHFIAMMPDYDMASAECRYQMDLWDEFDASEVFKSPFLGDETQPTLAPRLEGIAKIMDSMAREAERIGEEKPGEKEVFSAPSKDLGLFDSCARVLIRRGKTLKHLRPIAEAIFSYVTGNPPADYWAKRQENEAIKKYKTHPPKKE